MINVDSRKMKEISTYKISEEERLEITNKLKDAILLNNSNSEKTEWNSNNYRI